MASLTTTLRLRPQLTCALASLVLGALATVLLKPGWLFWDSSTQWQWARRIATEGLPRAFSDYDIQSQWPVMNTLVKVPFCLHPDGGVLYTWLQATALYFGVLSLARALAGRWSYPLAAGTLLLCLWPNVINIAVFHSSDTLAAVMVCVLISVAVDRLRGDDREQRSQGTQIARLVLPLLLGVVLTALRLNAVTFLAFLAPAVIWCSVRPGRFRVAVTLIGTAVCLILPVQLTRQLDRTAYFKTTASEGLALKLWMQDAQYPDNVAVRGVLPDIVRQRVTTIDPATYTLGRWTQQSLSSINWDRVHTDRELTGRLVVAYGRSFLEDPERWLAANAETYAAWLGIRSPLPNLEIGRYDIPPPWPELRMEPTVVRAWFLRAETWSNGYGFSSPALWLVFCLVSAGAAYARRRSSQELKGFGLTLILSLVYAFPMVIFSATPEVRYHFPFILPMATSVIASAVLSVSPCGPRAAAA